MSIASATSVAAPRVDLRSTPGTAVADVWWSAAAATAAVLAAVVVSSDCRHWFVLPVWLCGVLVGVEAVAWFRGRRDLFDPAGLTAVAGWHLFFAAPLLHVVTQYWMLYVEPPSDWRPWLGRWAWLNVAGLALYYVIRGFLAPTHATPRTAELPRSASPRVIDDRRFQIVWLAALGISAALQALVYLRFGGLGGYIAAFSEGAEQFAGYGTVFMVSESFPILFVIAAAWWARKYPQYRTAPFVFGVLVAFVALKIAFGGLRGSRGHLIYGLFWGAGILHCLVHPLSRKALFPAVAALLGFMYVYGFYKDFGADALGALTDDRARAGLVDASPRTFPTLLLGDLARCDVQAYLLYRMSPERLTGRYAPCRGETYLGTLALFVPRRFWPDRPPTKIKAGTDAMFGPHVFTHEMASTYSYGLAGEALLNFGPIGALVSFALPAWVVVGLARRRRALADDDVRQLLWPFALSVGLMLWVWDSDVLVFYTLKEGLLPAALLWSVSRPAASLPVVAETVR